MKTLLALSCLALFACDLGRNRAPDERPTAFNNARITGVVTLPEGLADASGACSNLSIQAKAGAAETLGNVIVRQSRGRCSYEISQLPTQAELALVLRGGSGWACQNGSSVGLLPDAQTVTLQDHETRTQDFRGSCSATSAK
jgi:hypothetical protein